MVDYTKPDWVERQEKHAAEVTRNIRIAVWNSVAALVVLVIYLRWL